MFAASLTVTIHIVLKNDGLAAGGPAMRKISPLDMLENSFTYTG
jgi:hypothetical protein